MLHRYTLTPENSPPIFFSSQREATKEAQRLSHAGVASKVHRVTEDGPKFVLAVAARTK